MYTNFLIKIIYHNVQLMSFLVFITFILHHGHISWIEALIWKKIRWRTCNSFFVPLVDDVTQHHTFNECLCKTCIIQRASLKEALVNKQQKMRQLLSNQNFTVRLATTRKQQNSLLLADFALSIYFALHVFVPSITWIYNILANYCSSNSVM